MRRKRRIGIRIKISLGFVILAAMLFISDALALRELSNIGGDVRQILDDSYRSVEYGQSMLNLLAMQQFYIFEHRTTDSARRGEAEREFRHTQTDFANLLVLARDNLKYSGEGLALDSIGYLHGVYTRQAENLMRLSASGQMAEVAALRGVVHRLRMQINSLILLNQKALYTTVQVLDKSTRRAIRPGIVVLVVGVLFIFMFTYLISHFYVIPIIRLTKVIRQYVKYGRYRAEPLRTNDELEELSEAVDSLVQFSQHGSPERKLP